MSYQTKTSRINKIKINNKKIKIKLNFKPNNIKILNKMI